MERDLFPKQSSLGQPKQQQDTTMQYNDIEMKLIRLALDKGAHDGEFANAASMLIKQLRKRGVTPEQMSAGGSNPMGGFYESLYRQAQSNATYYQTKANNLQVEVSRLEGLLSRARQASGTTGESTQSSYYSNAAGTPPPPRTRRPRRAAYGIRVLSDMQRALLFKIARRAVSYFGDDLGRPMQACCDTHQEFGTIQQLMRKGMVEKLSRRGWHKLTEQGIAYWKRYGSV